MKRTSSLRRAIGVGLAIAVAGPGCTHNYYYSTPGGCPPMVGSTVATQVGQTCDVPSSTTPAPIVAGAPVAGQSAVVTPNSQRVVTSIPTLGGRRGGWRTPPAESMARTTVDGAIDSTVNR